MNSKDTIELGQAHVIAKYLVLEPLLNLRPELVVTYI